MKLKQLLKDMKPKPNDLPPRDGEKQQGYVESICEHCGKFNGRVCYSNKHQAWVCLSCHCNPP